jgi:cytoskeletal protein CcmA (bactofilin family)
MGKMWGSKGEISAFMGKGTEFEGILKFEGVIRLDGRFNGEIRSDGTLIIGPTAHIRAEIEVDTVIVSGEVHGNIRAKNRVQLHAPAKCHGNLISPVVTIDEGVLFEGNCHMNMDIAAEPRRPSVPGRVTVISRDGESKAQAEIL